MVTRKQALLNETRRRRFAHRRWRQRLSVDNNKREKELCRRQCTDSDEEEDSVIVYHPFDAIPSAERESDDDDDMDCDTDTDSEIDRDTDSITDECVSNACCYSYAESKRRRRTGDEGVRFTKKVCVQREDEDEVVLRLWPAVSETHCHVNEEKEDEEWSWDIDRGVVEEIRDDQ